MEMEMGLGLKVGGSIFTRYSSPDAQSAIFYAAGEDAYRDIDNSLSCLHKIPLHNWEKVKLEIRQVYLAVKQLWLLDGVKNANVHAAIEIEEIFKSLGFTKRKREVKILITPADDKIQSCVAAKLIFDFFSLPRYAHTFYPIMFESCYPVPERFGHFQEISNFMDSL